MSVFWLLFSFFVILFSYYGDESKTKNWIVSRCSRFFLLITLSAVLATCGLPFSDHEHYSDLFYYINSLKLRVDNLFDLIFLKTEGIISPVENGFFLLTKLLFNNGLSHVGYFFILGCITNFFIIKVFYRFKYPTIAFMIYITSVHFSQEFNLVRQMMAVAIVIFAVGYIEEKKWKPYLGAIFIGFLLHQSAIIGLLFLPLCFIENISEVWKICIRALIPIYLLSLLIAIKIIHVDLSLLSLGLDVYEGYLVNEQAAGIDKVSINWLYNFLVVITFLSYKGEKGKYVYSLFFIIGGILINISVPAPNLARLSYFFTIIYPAFATEMLAGSKPFNLRRISRLSVAALATFHGLVIVKFILVGNSIIGTKVESLLPLFR